MRSFCSKTATTDSSLYIHALRLLSYPSVNLSKLSLYPTLHLQASPSPITCTQEDQSRIAPSICIGSTRYRYSCEHLSISASLSLARSLFHFLFLYNITSPARDPPYSSSSVLQNNWGNLFLPYFAASISEALLLWNGINTRGPSGTEAPG